MIGSHGTIRYRRHVTYGGNEVLCSQSKVLAQSYWLSVHTRGGHVQHGALGSEVIASRHLYRGCIEPSMVTELTCRK